jgi:hypothetical protein
VSDIDTVVVDSLKALDPEWPIREADIPIISCRRAAAIRGTVRFLRRHDRGQGQVLRFRGVAEPSLHETADHESRLWRFGWVGQTFYEGRHERLGGRSARPTARRLFAGQVALSLEILFGSIKR